MTVLRIHFYNYDMRSIVVFTIAFNLYSFAFADECVRWFENAKIKKGKNCVLKCSSTPVSMGTFVCTSKCDKLCKMTNTKESETIYKDYNELTYEERKLLLKHPKKMLDAYSESRRALSTCSKLYGKMRLNDTSDACRHFIWSAFLYKKFGNEFSTKVLEAHEQKPDQPVEEKAMDIANNRLGQSAARKLVDENRYSENEVVKAFKENLTNDRLIILRKIKGD